MKKLVATTLLSALFAMPAAASVLTMETELGTSMEAVRKSLTELGYDVRKAEMEDGMIEVYFIGNGEKGEVYVNPQTGKPVKIKLK